jgi:hypothetical protein
VGVHQDAQHAKGLIVLNKAHPAHVRRQLKDDIDAARRAPARIEFAQVANQILDGRRRLMPFVHRFNVRRTNYIDPLAQ